MSTLARPGRLADKIAIVTGAAGGQGAAFAHQFGVEGAAVIAVDVAEPSLDRKAVHRFVRMDVSSEPGWGQLVDEVLAEHGRVDVLVNNAGAHLYRQIDEMTLDEYRSVVNTNQIGCFLGMRAVIPAKKRQGAGSIVNIASTSAMRGQAGSVAYGATKWAVRGMTKVAAVELGEFGVRANCVLPGAVNTRMLVAAGASLVSSDQPIQRIAQPDEIAPLLVYLASDESTYCTGADFVIDGGSTAGRKRAPRPAGA